MDASPHALTRALRSTWAAALLFLGLTLFVTWPLGAGLGRYVPGDYGDPLYVAWALAWVSHQLGRFLTGELGALVHIFDANQLHPEPAALALSDHFIAQAVPLAPVYWITANPILLIGLAYLVAFTMCGFSMWLLVREVTGSSAAGILAGVVFAFNEIFVNYELSHLQVISAQWMPLTIYALRRYFVTGSLSSLAGAAASLIALNLSAGYYLLMFPPFVALYVAWELTARRRWRDRRTWQHLAVAAVGVAAITAPFLWPYVTAQQRMGFSRSVGETTAMAATIDGYLAAGSRLFFAYGCAAGAIAAWVIARFRGGPAPPLAAFAFTAAALSCWLSLGPAPAFRGEHYPSLGVYGWAQAFVPGVNAIRVPSRFAAVFLVFLGLLSGVGAAAIVRLRALGGAAVLIMAGVTVGANAPASFRVDEVLVSAGYAPPADYLTPRPEPPPIYRYVASLPASTVLTEIPFADFWYNTRYLYFSTFHWHPLVNGFTSFFPPDYAERVRWLINPVRTPDEAWNALLSGRTTHVIVHTGAYQPDYAQQLDGWLTGKGAKRQSTFDGAAVYEMPR